MSGIFGKSTKASKRGAGMGGGAPVLETSPGEAGEVINDIDAELTKVEAMASALGAEVGMEPVQSYATQAGAAVIQRKGDLE